MPAQKGRRSKRRASPWQGSVRLGMVFAVLIGVNVYFFFLRGGTSLRALMKTTELAKHDPSAASALLAQPSGASAQPAPKLKADDASAEEARVVEGVMADNDTVERRWKTDGLPPKQVNDVAASLGKLFDLRTVRAGHSYSLRFDGEDHLRSLEYRVSPALAYHVVREGNGWKATKDEKPLEIRQAEIGGVIGSSLYEAIKRSGESTTLVGWFVDTFAWDLNFYTDSQAGDRFKIIVEKKFLGGHFYKYGRVLAAEYSGRTGTFRAFWFQPANASQEGSYFTEHGESIVKSMLKTPLKYVRVSSAFDRHRFHPILHTEKAHLGVDYAAPLGTPVWATTGGRVAFVGPRGGAGNAVILDHPNGMSSTYMHLSKFARGLAVGQTVRQKQVIGYVGMTGLATGPHLHFSIRVNGVFVDPLKLKPARDASIDPKHRQEFADVIGPRLQALAAIPVVPPPDRLLAHGLSPMP
ncbi:MAG TPA: M23 family metallopeptidase [Polyangia bacterium]|nr:M23 family metallopeptidase [Polyangia bacterium]